jgi:DNA-binding NtrC family response regulator
MTTRGHLPPLALVIDDDHLMGQLCARTLDRFGLQVVCCDTSVKAANLMQLHSHRIVWILADVVLATPGTKLRAMSTTQESNGARLLSLLTYVCPSAIAVQMSAYSLPELAELGYTVETPRFLQKPFTPETLRAMVKELLPHLHIPSEPIRRDTDEVAWVG